MFHLRINFILVFALCGSLVLFASPLRGGVAGSQEETPVLTETENETEAARQNFLTGLALEYRADIPPDATPDYPTIAKHYQAAAQGGSREALWALARLSGPSQPLYQGPEQWRNHLLAAAQANWPEAAYRLGEALEKNLIPSSGLNPATYYAQAAMAGHGRAALRLGQMYLDGKSLPHNENQAAVWLTMAAENQVEEAALNLGELYYHKNPSVALRWLERTSSAQGAYLMGELYLQDKRSILAVASFTSAADRDHPQAHLALGLLNLNNDLGLRTNPRAAIKHLKEAAQAGLPDGCFQLGQMYIAGQATPKDAITGSFWLHQAALGGHPTAGEELDKIRVHLSPGRQKRLERMIEEGSPLHGKVPLK